VEDEDEANVGGDTIAGGGGIKSIVLID